MLITAIYQCYRIQAGPVSRSPEAGPGLGWLVIGLILFVILAVGLVLLIGTLWHSVAIVSTIVFILGYVAASVVFQPFLRLHKQKSFEREQARSGSFADPVLQAMAQAIRDGDCNRLRDLLKGHPPPTGSDAKGQDLLTFAIAEVVDAKQNPNCVRTLLEAGASTRELKASENPIRQTLFYNTPDATETLRLLLAHGADPNGFLLREADNLEVLQLLVEAGADMNPKNEYGLTPLIEFVATRKWEQAQYLVEKGASLEGRSAEGVSLDYYLNDWKDSVYGEHPPGWDDLRAALSKRR